MNMKSTRMKLLLIGIGICVAKEVCAQMGIEIPTETFLSIEAMILGLMGLDTVRPVGKGYPPEVLPAVEEASDESA